jgi:hypothetical protein
MKVINILTKITINSLACFANAKLSFLGGVNTAGYDFSVVRNISPVRLVTFVDIVSYAEH